MASNKVSVECPACSTKLSLSDKSKLGKKLRCPKCKEIFVPTVAEEDDVGDIEDDTPDQPEVQSNRRKSAGAKRSPKSSTSGSSRGDSSMLFIVCGVAGLLIIDCLGVYLFYSGVFSKKPIPGQNSAEIPVETPAPVVVQLTPAEKAFGLRWMPAETELIIHAKLSDIWQAPLLKGPLNDPAVTQSFASFKDQMGIGPTDIESITLGLCNVPDVFASVLAAGVGGKLIPALQSSGLRCVGVMKTKKPVDWKQISSVSPGVTTKESNGKSYFESPIPPGTSGGYAWWSPEANTLIFGTSKEVVATLERGETVTPPNDFSLIDHLPHLVIALAIPNFESNPKYLALETVPGFTELRGMVKPFALQLSSIGLTVKGGFDLHMSTSDKTNEGSKNLKLGIEDEVAKLRSMFATYEKTAPPLIGELGNLLFANLRVDQENRIVKVSTSIPDSAQAKLEQLPPVVIMMAMTGGFGTRGGSSNIAPKIEPTTPASNSTPASPGNEPSPSNPSPVNPASPAAAASPTPVAIKLPGETESVNAMNANGLLEGLSMSVKTAWGLAPANSTNNNKSKTLDIVIDVTGSGIETICGSAGVFPKAITLGGGTLKKRKQSPSSGAIPETAFRPFDASDDSSIDHPPQTLRLKFTVDAPTTDGKQIDVLEGSFRFLTADESEELTIENAVQAAKQPLTAPEFKAAKIQLQQNQLKGGPASFALACGKDYFIGRLRGTPGETFRTSEVNKDRTIQRLISNHQGGLFPDDFQINFTLHSKLKEHLVTFRFENVPLPDQESSPSIQ